MKAKFEQNELVLHVPLADEGSRSRSGKSEVIATSRGQQYLGNWHGKPVYLQLNVIRMNKEAGAQAPNVIQMERPLARKRKGPHRVTSAGARKAERGAIAG